MKRLLPLLLLTTSSVSRAPRIVAAAPFTLSGPAYGIGLEAVAYPYPVKFLPLSLEGQDVRMAYMDVRPRTTNGVHHERGTVLLLHGKNFYGAYWKNTIVALNAAGYRVIVPDQIGFGKSSKPDIPYSFDLLAANTAKLLDTLGVPKVAVVGHSMGGMLAVRFARNYPQRMTRLVLEDPIGLEDYRKSGVPFVPFEKLYADELADTDPAKIRAFYRRYFVTWQPAYEKFVQVEAGVARSGEFPRWAKASARTYQMIFQQPVRGEFSLLRVPTLLVIGQSDRTAVGRNYAPEAAKAKLGNYPLLGRAAQRDIPGARLVELPHVGHIPHLEAPTQFHAALLNFLEKSSAG